jgi:hypothetical protein
LIRYIHLNPVRAGLVADPVDYPWSGHRAYLGLARVPWLTTEFALRVLGRDAAGARRRYERMIGLGTDSQDSVRFSRGVPGDCRVLGPDRFLAQLAAKSATSTRRGRTSRSGPQQRRDRERDTCALDRLIEETAAECGVTVEALTSPSRSAPLTRARCIAAARAIDSGLASLSSIARRLNRSHSSLCEALQRMKRRRQRVAGRPKPEDPTDPTTGTS